MWAEILPLAHCAATWFMVGLIWFVQVSHYPLFRLADPVAYVPAHIRRTTLVVAPPMLLELALSVLLVWSRPGPLAWTGLALLFFVWLSTALLQVPIHRRLARGFEAAPHRRLVRTNWIRTVLWSARGAVAMGILA